MDLMAAHVAGQKIRSMTVLMEYHQPKLIHQIDTSISGVVARVLIELPANARDLGFHENLLRTLFKEGRQIRLAVPVC